ncbi:MAG TPA: YtxH domain-containing protein [Ignavibacteriaceae bacterium]|jgi:gas vesicle protein|nr:YtxH domain-containing protein [Ignavibacteriaceae bacterium]
MSKDNGSGKNFLIGFIAGGAIGAIFALLYAPKSGKELRGDIKSKTDSLMDDANEYINEAKDKAKDLINDGRKKSDKLISEAKVKSEELLKDAEKIFNDAKAKANTVLSVGKETIEKETDNLKSAFKAGVDAYKNTKNS